MKHGSSRKKLLGLDKEGGPLIQGMVLVHVFNLKLRPNLLLQGEGEMMSHEIRRGGVNQPQVEGTGKLQRNSQSKQLFLHQI